MNRLQKYAQLIITSGVHVQKGQNLMINASIHAIELTRLCVEAAYQAGAKRVIVFYNDEYNTRNKFLYEDEAVLCDIHQWQIDSKLDYFKEGGCILELCSETPGIMNGLDAAKLSAQQFALANANKEAQEYTMNNKAQWCLVAVPNKEWAAKVFPEFEDVDAAVNELWEQIFHSVHITQDNDPIVEWTNLNNNFKKRVDLLNRYRFKALHFTNQEGTDVVIELVNHHIWVGGGETTQSGIAFNPNMPTEEIFTMPKKTGVQGKVVASKPLLYNGGWIEDFWLVFKDGKVVDYHARIGHDILQRLINFDEGSCYLGEVALVPFDSPISKSGILFLNTLFDENASCHIALGDAYPSNVEGGIRMSEEELAEAGANHSMTHVDFMFGTSDMVISGITQDDETISVFKNGNFVF